MSEYPHPGLHPEADSLNAFIEGVLPEHERLECLAHLADCARCREIVYLAQEPVVPTPVAADPVPFWKGWFAPIPVLAAALVCVLLVSIGVYRLIPPKRVEPVLTAVATPVFEPPPPTSEAVKQPPARRPAKAVAAPVVPAPIAALVDTAPPSPAAPPPPPPPPQFAAAAQAFVETRSAQAPIVTSGIAGTVTNTTGGVVPMALVTVRPATGTSSIDTRTDSKGQFNLAGLAPGPYELQILSPGFKQAKKEIDLQPQLVARADSILEVGAAADSVIVVNGLPVDGPLLKTESGEISHTITTDSVSNLPVLTTAGGSFSGGLPAKLPPPTTASKDKLMLKADSAGALFFSKNSGKSWKVVKPRWPGKVVRVELAHVPGAVFQFTTDSGSVWLSRDGAHWNPASSPR